MTAAVLEQAASYLTQHAIEVVPEKDPTGPSINARSLAAFAALEPDLDEPVPVLPTMLLDQHELEALRVNAQRLHEAKQAHTSAEQVLAGAERTARQLEPATMRAGAIAARALAGNAGDMAEAARVTKEIEDARLAVSALPALRDAVSMALDTKNRAIGSLRACADTCLGNARFRAAKRYAAAAREATKALAHVVATVELQPRLQAALGNGLHGHVVSELSIPALPTEIRAGEHAGVTSIHFRDSYASPEHPAFTGAKAIAMTQLRQQIDDATAGVVRGLV